MKEFRKRIRWFLAELTIVISGVLIALALNAWWQEVEDHRTEQELVSSLAAEFKQNIASLEARRTRYLQRQRSAQALIDLGSTVDQVSADSLDAIWRQVLRGGSYDPTIGMLSSASSSGTITLIQDASLKADLAQWPSMVNDVGDVEDRISTLLLEQFMPWLRNEISIPNGFGASGIPPSRLRHRNPKIYTSFRFENYLREIVAWGDILDQSIVVLLTASTDILERLESRDWD